MMHTKAARPRQRKTRRERMVRGFYAPARPVVSNYDRRSELPRIVPLWPHELDDESPEGRRNIVSKLRRALRAERRRGIAGHWTYDLARHAELLRIYGLELASSGMRDVRPR